MPQVVVLFEYPTLNGGERSLLSVVEPIRDAGFTLSALAPSKGPLAEELRCRQVRHIAFDSHRADGTRLELSELRKRLQRRLEDNPADLVHANSLSTARISGPVARDMGLSSIGHLRDIVRLNDTVVRDLNCHTRLLAVSHATRDFHVAGGIDADRTFVIYNGIDTKLFQPRPPTGFLHQQFGLPPSSRLVGGVGQIALRKGFDITLQAARQVVAVLPNTHFLIVGARYSEKEESRSHEHLLHQLAVQPPLDGHVHFLGTRADIATILPELALLAHSARQEPLGRVLIEAAACGLPIIATDVGGTRELFPPEAAAAILVPPEESATLARGILRILGDPSLAARLGQAARNRIEQAFHHTTAAKQLIDQYEAVI